MASYRITILSAHFILCNRTMINRNDSSAEVPHHFVLMRYHQNRRTALIDSLKQFDNFIRKLRIDVASRFVRDNNRRIVYQCARQCNALLFAAGNFMRKTLRFFLKPQQIKNIRHTGSNNFSRGVGYPQAESNVFIHRHIRNQTEILKNDAQLSAVIWNLSLL